MAGPPLRLWAILQQFFHLNSEKRTVCFNPEELKLLKERPELSLVWSYFTDNLIRDFPDEETADVYHALLKPFDLWHEAVGLTDSDVWFNHFFSGSVRLPVPDRYVHDFEKITAWVLPLAIEPNKKAKIRTLMVEPAFTEASRLFEQTITTLVPNCPLGLRSLSGVLDSLVGYEDQRITVGETGRNDKSEFWLVSDNRSFKVEVAHQRVDLFRKDFRGNPIVLSPLEAAKRVRDACRGYERQPSFPELSTLSFFHR